MPNAWFSDPGHPDSDPKDISKINLETSMDKSIFACKVSNKFSKQGPLIHQKSMPRLCKPRALSNGQGPALKEVAHKIHFITIQDCTLLPTIQYDSFVAILFGTLSIVQYCPISNNTVPSVQQLNRVSKQIHP